MRMQIISIAIHLMKFEEHLVPNWNANKAKHKQDKKTSYLACFLSKTFTYLISFATLDSSHMADLLRRNGNESYSALYLFLFLLSSSSS
jgi:hypothetical protein